MVAVGKLRGDAEEEREVSDAGRHASRALIWLGAQLPRSVQGARDSDVPEIRAGADRGLRGAGPGPQGAKAGIRPGHSAGCVC